ncbi:hypothetical protein Tco_0562094 [Tanacetum coccineum]
MDLDHHELSAVVSNIQIQRLDSKSQRHSIKLASERLKLCEFTIEAVVGDTTAAVPNDSPTDKGLANEQQAYPSANPESGDDPKMI